MLHVLVFFDRDVCELAGGTVPEDSDHAVGILASSRVCILPTRSFALPPTACLYPLPDALEQP
eukprot:CAMPEP_0204591932 /NCGR_PEP_ID=MMETSP0661-20131031/50647_1 /ASSEMBLY_ACC=CAM_ASM_000606 /TAXON_ID=109239 /ORGANISM="Alexandrium margalefi, Strain AMGDE01CS-322" /LENGTH=62 /DNA_ID=CAMNT_0051602103 /DNA_START=642 /DNA_END=830 /DNA_ORIENTATION=+